MTTPNSLPQPAQIIAGVEEYFDSLPAKRRRRTQAEINEQDTTPETENYNGMDPAAVSIRCELTHADQVTLHLLLWELGRARGASAAHAIIVEIRDMVGLSYEMPSYEEAMGRRYRGEKA
jgi:hypothetical protein